MAGAVQMGSLIGVEQKDKQIVQQQEHQHKDHHKPYFPQFDLTQFKSHYAYDQKSEKYPGIVGDHTCKGKKQKKCQLGSSGQFVYHTFSGKII